MRNEINVIKDYSEAEYKEKGSKFIALAFPVQTEEETLAILERTRREYYDASHHCYAYKLSNDKTKYSDAGEPTGTAGVRILNAIDHFSLLDILVIVVRYFGGTKLGAGGLGRAYYNSAFEVLNKADLVIKKLFQKIFLTTEHNFTQNVYHVFSSYESKILKVDFDDKVRFECVIKHDEKQKIFHQLTDATNGLIEILEDKLLYI